jgi:Ca2+-binding RTX toxin-like protein
MTDISAGPDTTASIDFTYAAGGRGVGTFSGQLEVAGDSDWIAIDLVAGTTYSFFLNAIDRGSSDFGDALIRIYSPEGLLIVEDDNAGAGLNARIATFTATANDRYYIEAAQPDGSTFANTYWLTVFDHTLSNVAPPAPDDANNFEYLNLIAARIQGGRGKDTLDAGTAGVTLMGEQGDDVLIGNGNDNILIGGHGSDELYGSNGNDLMIGDSGDDVMFGSDDNDTLIGGDGNDFLNSGGGVDHLEGGAGDDEYLVQVGDTLSEAANAGIDTVFSGNSHVLGANFENLVISNSDPRNGTGNALDNAITGGTGANRLMGLGGNDILSGLGGTDTLMGGLGNDTYVGITGDIVTENANEGIDTILSSVHGTLSGIQHVENLTLTGAANLNASGNSLDNRLTGNGGDNRLRGGAGIDTLDGRGGVDTYVFAAVSESTGIGRDRVLNMTLDQDKFDFTVIPTSIGAQVNAGALNVATFDANLAAAVNAGLAVNGAILFDPSSGDMNVSGQVYLVVDGNGDGVYTVNADYVVQLHFATGTLSLDDFT